MTTKGKYLSPYLHGPDGEKIGLNPSDIHRKRRTKPHGSVIGVLPTIGEISEMRKHGDKSYRKFNPFAQKEMHFGSKSRGKVVKKSTLRLFKRLKREL